MRKRIQMEPTLALEGRHSRHSWTKAHSTEWGKSKNCTKIHWNTKCFQKWLVPRGAFSKHSFSFLLKPWMREDRRREEMATQGLTSLLWPKLLCFWNSTGNLQGKTRVQKQTLRLELSPGSPSGWGWWVEMEREKRKWWQKGMLLWLYHGADILISGLMAKVHKIRGWCQCADFFCKQPAKTWEMSLATQPQLWPCN